MVVVTGEACRPEVVRDLAVAGVVVVVWTADAARAGELVRLVLDAGGRAAAFVGPAEAAATVVAFATEQFGGLDDVVGGSAGGG